jgi:hypothetical protein
MAVAVVAVGSVATGSGTSLAITTPAGSSGDLVVFFMVHDDYSDGAWSASSPPVTITTIHDGSPQTGDDSRSGTFWGIEDQAGGRSFTFIFSVAEGFAGVCIRFSGHDATTPIQAGSVVPGIFELIPSTNADRYGDMFVGAIYADTSFSGSTTPTDWAGRIDGGTGTAFIFIATKPADTYPFPETHAFLGIDDGLGGAPGETALAFVIAQDTGVSYTISGVTKDKDGSVLVSCEVALFKDIGGSPPAYQYVASVTSDAGDGTYSFTVYENPSSFMVYSIKDDTPHVFDATDNVLQPA